MYKVPGKINFVNLHTKIENLDRLTDKLKEPNVFIKRDDQTDFQVSENKIRMK